MRITDQITDTILRLLDEQGGEIQIQRNDLASRLGCVPSQINYVITSRFTKEQGYIVESRRGGGGFVRIVRIDCTKPSLIMHVINSIGPGLDEASARMIVKSLYQNDAVTEEQARMMLAAIPEENFRGIPDPLRQEIRGNLLKSMLINTL